MKWIKIMLVTMGLIILSSCTKTAYISDVILNEVEAEEVEVNGEIAISDFQRVEDDSWLVPVPFVKDGEMFNASDSTSYLEFLELEEEIIEKLKAHDMDTSHIHLMVNEDDFIVMWDSAAGKVYTYDMEKDYLQLVLETDTTENFNRDEFTGKVYFTATTNGDSLYLTKDDVLYIYDRSGKQITAKTFPENFEIYNLGKSFLQLKNGDEVYFYFYDDESLNSFDGGEFLAAYYKDYFISQKDNGIYAIDIINEKLYSYESEEIEDTNEFDDGRFMVSPDKDAVRILDFDNLLDSKEFKIELPEL